MNRLFLFLSTLCPLFAFAAAQRPFDLSNGDRVVFIGDTLIEREQHYAYVETLMTAKFAAKGM